MNPVRSFFGIALPGDAKARLGQLQQDLPPGVVRRVEPAGMHLTLRFMGECHAELLERLINELRSRSFPSFTFGLQGTGAFPDPRRPHAIWAGVDPPETLLRLQEELERVCREHGLKAETREFVPHVTLGRTEGAPDDRLYRWLRRHRDWEGGGVHVDWYGLFESIPTAEGRAYEVRSRLPLTGGEGRR